MNPKSLPEVVWLLRHAETSAPQVFHGAESDIGLSERGERQTEALADWFRSQRPTALVTSGMSRAMATGRPTANVCDLRHRLAPKLHERFVGGFSGRPFVEVEASWRTTLEHWNRGDTAYTTEGAESYDQLRERLLPAWHELTSQFAGERLVVVAHGIVCKVLLLELLADHGPAAWARLGKIANCSVSVLKPTESGWMAESLLQVPEPVFEASGREFTGIGQQAKP
ncbi:MAG: histidine phosphatase family protein [Fimbriiglobus sp.]